MAQILLQDVTFSYDSGQAPVFQHLNLQLDTDWRLALVGRNGRGKTTLLRLLEGTLSGTGSISLPLPCRRHPRPVAHPEALTRQVLAELEPEAEQWQLLREFSLLGLDESLLERPYRSLSGGEQTRVSLAALFAREDTFPLLDEPTNHLDAAGREQLSRYLRKRGRGFLLVSHDSAFLDDCVDHVLALNPSGPEVIQGNFSTWFLEKERRDQREQAEDNRLRREIAHLQDAADRAARWSNRTEASKFGTTNSGIKPDRGYVGHKAAKLMKRSKHAEKRRQQAVEEKSELLRDLERADPLSLTPLPFRGKPPLLEARELAPVLGGRTVCAPLSFTLEEGERLCLSGPNGSGKTSLFRLLLGEALDHTGLLRLAGGLTVSYLPQSTAGLRGPLRAFPQEQGVDATRFFTLLRKLDFPRALFDEELESLSLGQKKKALLAASLCRDAHLYLWDEPLNDIDIFSRKQLEGAVLRCRPTLIFVEHDRAFAQNIATRVLRL